jgi:hypothetical protein
MRFFKQKWKPLRNSPIAVIPAKAGIQGLYRSKTYKSLDSRFRGNDEFCRGFQKWLEKRMNIALVHLRELNAKTLSTPRNATFNQVFLCVT